MKTRSLPALLAGFLAAAVSLLAVAADADAQIRIFRKSGTVEMASEIVTDKYTEFAYKIRGNNQPQTLTPLDVAELVFEKAPDLFNEGLELIESGEYENAANALAKLLTETSDPILKPYVLYHLAEAYLMWGSQDPASPHNAKAIELGEQFLREYPEARIVPKVRLLLGRAQMQSGNFDEAERYFKQLEDDARANFGQDWEIRAKYWGAQNLEAKGNYAEARNLYASLSNTAKKAAETVNERSLLKPEYERLENIGIQKQGNCLLAAGNLDEAERYYEGLKRTAERAQDLTLLPGALNGLGEVYLEKGDFRKARFQFTTVFVKYFHVPEETLRALYGIGECYEKLDGIEPGARAKSVDFFREVIDRNKSARLNSPWAQKAKAKI
jgi:tetratricopeptide (TPR) repeat protein